MEDLLATITHLSHEFGTPDYVRGGGGNTSAKQDRTLWVKPSGTTLAGLTPERFVALDRATLRKLYRVEPPAEAHAREALVKERMAAAVLPDSPGRPSVEAPLHESLSARFVVHTHPTLVNGLTCARAGRAAAKRLFPEALWLDFIDPGYTLCMRVRREIEDYAWAHGHQPGVILLKNHGVFVAGDSAAAIREQYGRLMDALRAEYARAAIPLTVPVADSPVSETVREALRRAVDNDTAAVAASVAFPVPAGPISPDHIVYARSFPLCGEPTVEAVAAYRQRYGYAPRIIAWEDRVYAVEATDKKAALALEMAQDGAVVEGLAQAFGGIDYMTEPARRFIETWEVESYRSQQL